MSGSVYDRLQQKLEVQKRSEGISALEIADLPPSLRKIMRLMLREVEMSHADLCAHVHDLPEKDRLEMVELNQALEELVKQGWLIRRGEGKGLNYSVNLKRKPGSTLTSNIWGDLEAKLNKTR